MIPDNISRRLTIDERNQLTAYIKNYAQQYHNGVVGNDENKHFSEQQAEHEDEDNNKDLLHLVFIVCFVVACILGALCIVNCTHHTAYSPMLQ